MAQVSVYINGREYKLACDDGQEPHLIALAKEIDRRTSEMGRQLGQTSEIMPLILSSLTLADELHELKKQVSELQKGAKKAGKAVTREDEALAGALYNMAERIDRVSKQLELLENKAS